MQWLQGSAGADDLLLEGRIPSAGDARDIALRRFLLEARATAALSHPNIAALYEKTPLATLKVWEEQGPPKGTLFHYPNPYNHQTLSIAASPAPPKIAQQIYTQATLTKMCVRFYQGEPMEKTLSWAEGELEGFMRS